MPGVEVPSKDGSVAAISLNSDRTEEKRRTVLPRQYRGSIRAQRMLSEIYSVSMGQWRQGVPGCVTE